MRITVYLGMAFGLADAQKLGLRTENNGDFSISLDGRPWLAGHEVVVQGLTVVRHCA